MPDITARLTRGIREREVRTINNRRECCIVSTQLITYKLALCNKKVSVNKER